METMLDFKEKVHEQEVLKLMYTIWRLKYGLRASKRLDIQMSQMKTGTLGQLNMGIESIRTINDGLMLVLTYIRESINDLLFDLFVRSVSSASNKKQNSLILFILNVREFKKTKLDILLILVEAYTRLRAIAKRFIPTYASLHQRLLAQIGGEDNARLTSKITDENFSRLDQEPNNDVFRDNINKWIECTLSICVRKYNENPTEKNRDFLFLYRLLTISYRVKYPLRGRPLNPDVDLKVYLEHKICSALRKVLQAEQSLVVEGRPGHY